jgi:hypothetical protein
MPPPPNHSILVGTSAFIGCGIAAYALHETIIAQALGGLLAILSIFSSHGPRQPTVVWPLLLVAGVAVSTAIAINVWALWRSNAKPRGGHAVFQTCTLVCSTMMLGLTLYISGTVFLQHHPDLLDDPFGSKAATRKREENAAYAAEKANEETRRREIEAHNAEAERLRVLRNQK